MNLERLALEPSEHGGTDAGPPVRWDFSTNANPLGPPPGVAAAVFRADRRHYPEPGYRALRAQIAQWHAADPAQVVPAASAGEFIWRLTQALRHCGHARQVWVPQPGYGEYAAAARALGCELRRWSGSGGDLPELQTGDLLWLCEPCNPTGQALSAPALQALLAHARSRDAVAVLDLAYAPLRLDGGAPLPAAACGAWQLWSPNKACGMTGVRGAYALAPAGQAAQAQALRRFAPAWVLGAEGAAMISAFCSEETRTRLAGDLRQLAAWKDALATALRLRGWQLRDSVTPFALARPPGPAERAAERHAAWRACGVKLRDAASFGLPGWVRLSAQPPEAQAALLAAWDRMENTG